MAVFTAFELRGGWIQELGLIHLTKPPFKGESIKIVGVNTEKCWYEVLEVELPTDTTTAGNLVVALFSGLPGSRG